MKKAFTLGCSFAAIVAVLLTASAAEAAGQLDGLYVGGKLSRESYDDNLNVTATDGVNTESYAINSLSGDGFAGALFIGYDVEVRGWHLGIEGEWGSGDADLNLNYTFNGEQFQVTVDAKQTYGVTARYGYEVRQNVLLYARTGWVETKFETNVGTSTKENGPRFGGGVELALSSRASIRAEYLYTDYGSSSVTYVEDGVLTTMNESLNGDSFALGLAIRF